ncbi:hypothetical protein BS50DRAFT_578980, partial [Corynespora cassiicola Philippines]
MDELQTLERKLRSKEGTQKPITQESNNWYKQQIKKKEQLDEEIRRVQQEIPSQEPIVAAAKKVADDLKKQVAQAKKKNDTKALDTAKAQEKKARSDYTVELKKLEKLQASVGEKKRQQQGLYSASVRRLIENFERDLQQLKAVRAQAAKMKMPKV